MIWQLLALCLICWLMGVYVGARLALGPKTLPEAPKPVVLAAEDAYRIAWSHPVGSDEWLRWVEEAGRLERGYRR